jgi:serine/threonine protein kinase
LGWLEGLSLALLTLLASLSALTLFFFGISTVVAGSSVPGGAASLLVAVLLGILSWAAYRKSAAAFLSAADGTAPGPAKSRMTGPGVPARQPPPPQASASVPAGPAAMNATLLGRRYELVRQLGEGGMGLVYAGRDLELGRFVAIKKMRPEIKLNQRDRKRFLREARLSAALHHPNIVDIYDIMEIDGEVFLIFEYVDGETLDRRLDSGPLAVEELRPALRFVCQALDYAHSQKVVHRDLKPSNIMLTRLGTAKVMDFGIAREIKDTASRLTRMDTSGTLAFMAPEQEVGSFDNRSDIFSLGVTLYEALTGELPFLGPNFLLQKERMFFKPLLEAAPQAPQDLRDAIERCLRYDPKERFQSVLDFAKCAGIGSS